ncbi:hypothetical protein M3Y95_01126800 [Aphelenchoides besseyi]|nr:hypothetical protein M3Y95_01126800 [Aphelenchoides besseyi]
MGVQLNENCRFCLLKHISKRLQGSNTPEHIHLYLNFSRFLLINRKFLFLIVRSNNDDETHLYLKADFDYWVLSKMNDKKIDLSLNLSSSLAIFFIRLSKLKLLTLDVRFFTQMRSLTSTVFRDVQRLCNAISDNPMIKGIELVPYCWRQLQLLLYDQLPDRIVKLFCWSRESVALLRQRCVMDSVEINEYGLEHFSYYHILQLPCRTFRFIYHPKTELTDSLPLKRNESIETIEMCVYTEFFDHRNQHRFADIFRNLRSINDKLKLRLETRFSAHDILDDNKLKVEFQTALSNVRELIDSAAAVHLPVESFFIDFGDYTPYEDCYYKNRWNNISEFCGFFTSLGFEKDDEETQKRSTEWTCDHRFSMVYKDIKVLTHTHFDY